MQEMRFVEVATQCSWRHSVFWLLVRDVWTFITQYLEKCCECIFTKNFSFGAFWDKDECVNFCGWKVEVTAWLRVQRSETCRIRCCTPSSSFLFNSCSVLHSFWQQFSVCFVAYSLMCFVQFWQQARNATNTDIAISGQHGLRWRHCNQEYVTCQLSYVTCHWHPHPRCLSIVSLAACPAAKFLSACCDPAPFGNTRRGISYSLQWGYIDDAEWYIGSA